MNRHLLDPRVWAPALLGIAFFAPRALPAPVAPTASRPQAIVLPSLHGAPATGTAQDLELLPERSAVHFLVQGPRGELLVACPACSGSLHLDAKGQQGSLELRLDLTSLPNATPDTGLDVHHVLGVHRSAEVVYRGTLVATTSSDLPGVQRLTFLGLLYFGDRALQQPMQLWQCSLPGQPLRLQGHGTVLGANYGLPSRRWLGLLDERHDVTLGLDLAWRRARGR